MLMTVDQAPENVEAFRRMCADNGVQINRFDPGGTPAGNPCFWVLADTKEAALAVVNFYFGEGG